jgi:hypothetical protein
MAQTPLRPFHGRIERPIKFELHNHSDVRAIASRRGDRIGAGCCVCSRPLMAQSGHSYRAPQCPLLTLADIQLSSSLILARSAAIHAGSNRSTT